ncbi:TPA: hypothetical protein ACS72U_004133 [Providencia alcalifaciens]
MWGLRARFIPTERCRCAALLAIAFINRQDGNFARGGRAYREASLPVLVQCGGHRIRAGFGKPSRRAA